MTETWNECQERDARRKADLAVADAVIRFSGEYRDRELFYLLQRVAGGQAASQAYRDRLHERFVEVCN
jgi:hypothetical protein